MTAGHFVGRVGGLAVALGIGAAVTHGMPTAWAEDTDSSSSADSAPGSDSKPATAAEKPGSDPVRATGSPSSTVDAQQSRTTGTPNPRKRKRATTAPAESHTQMTAVDAATGDNGEAKRTIPQDPPTPLDSPVTMTLMAVGTRKIQQQAVAAAQSEPTVATAQVGTPDSETGAVHGTVAEDDAQEYTVTVAPVKGSVELNPTSGDYTYTPTAAARVAAGQTPTADTDSFDVAITDTGNQVSTAAVSVYVSPIKFESQTPIAVGTNPTGMVVTNDGRMFVLNTGSKSISVINTVTGKRIDANASWFSKDIGVGTSPSALVLSPDGKRLYVTNTGSNNVSVINTANYKPIDVNPSWSSKALPVGAAPNALAFGPDGRLYVANGGSGTVSVIDPVTSKVIDLDPNTSGSQSIPVGTTPSGLAFGSDGRLYVTNRNANTVTVVNTATAGIVRTIAAGSQPSAIAAAPDGRLYVTNAGSSTVSVIDPNSSVTKQIPVGPSPSAVAFSPGGNLVYVVNGNDTVSVIDTVTQTVAGTVAFDTDTTGGHGITVAANGTIYVTDSADKTVRVLGVRFGNAAPTAGIPTVGAPNSGSGAVTGALNITDRDGDTLSYNVIQPSAGTVTVDAAGLYTFTPTYAARQSAATGGPTTASFTVTASDGQDTAVVSVTVPVKPPTAATKVSSLGSVTVPGYQVGSGPALTADGTRAVIVTYVPGGSGTTTRVAVVNVTTGKQIGGTLTLTGKAGPPVLSTDGSRAMITTSVPDPVTGVDITRATVVSIATGAAIGSPVVIAGSPSQTVFLGPDGGRALVRTDIYDVYHPSTTPHSTAIAVLSTVTGAQIGSTVIVAGKPADTLVSSNGHRVLISTSPASWDPIGTTRIAEIDATTGGRVGAITEIAGNLAGTVLVKSDASRALITTIAGDFANGYTTRAVVLDVVAGTKTETPLTGDSSVFGNPVLGLNNTRALVTTRTHDSVTDTFATRLAVIDTSTGAQIGADVVLHGEGHPIVSTDRTRAVMVIPATGNSTEVAVLDLATGTLAAPRITLAGSWSMPLADNTFGQQLLSADGSRALLVSGVTNPATGAVSTRVAVIDTITGVQTGTTLTLTGSEFGSRLVSRDGSRALIITHVYDGRTSVNTARLTVIDTTSGAQVGPTTELTGFLNGSAFSADAQRAVVTAISSNFATTGKATTQVVVINTATGAQVGTTLTHGDDTGLTTLSADGTRALVVTGTQLAVINTLTGTRVAATVTAGAYPHFTPDGTRVLITTGNNPTKVAVLQVV